eukprot:6180136-Pleurochrysis_carterae.AAC.3
MARARLRPQRCRHGPRQPPQRCLQRQRTLTRRARMPSRDRLARSRRAASKNRHRHPCWAGSRHHHHVCDVRRCHSRGNQTMRQTLDAHLYGHAARLPSAASPPQSPQSPTHVSQTPPILHGRCRSPQRTDRAQRWAKWRTQQAMHQQHARAFLAQRTRSCQGRPQSPRLRKQQPERKRHGSHQQKPR